MCFWHLDLVYVHAQIKKWMQNNKTKDIAKNLTLHCNGKGFKDCIHGLPYCIATASLYAAADETQLMNDAAGIAGVPQQQFINEQFRLLFNPNEHDDPANAAIDYSIFLATAQLAVFWVVLSLLRRVWYVLWRTRFRPYDNANPLPEIQEMKRNARKAAYIAYQCLDSLVII